MYQKIRKLAMIGALTVAITLLVVTKSTAGEGSDVIEESVEQVKSYTVQAGDTLYRISRQYNIPISKLMQYNGLTDSIILIGQKLYLPVGGDNISAVISRGDKNISYEDVMLLARLIHAEARGESFRGKVAVGAVILNRLKSPDFPHTIKDVIMEKNQYVYQFTPVADGSINLEPDDSSIQAALQALKGDDPTNGALFFYNPEVSTDKWIQTLPVVTRIGNHVFASPSKV